MGEDGIDIRQYSPETSQRPADIGEKFINNLRGKGLLTETTQFESVGVAATEGTNEVGNPNLFEKVRNQDQAPNGYLIGIGAANVFSMLEAYPEGQEPRAIILFDIDPAVVAEGQRLIKAYKETPPGPQTNPDHWEKIFSPYWNASPTNAMKKYARLLHTLAAEGNLVIARADFNNPRLAQEIANLPDFKKLNNIIYLSNIVDHLWRKSIVQDPSYIPNLDSLTPLTPDSPNRNYYIDTLQHGLAYRLRISTSPPQFSKKDFNPYADMTHIQSELTDQIGGPNENLLREDVTGWSTEQLIQHYNQIIKSPIGLERMHYIEERIRESRNHTLEKYPEYRELAAQPPREIYPGRFQVIDLPSTPEEEAHLLRDLQREYSYERDFIPFVAHGYWRDAKTVEEVEKYGIPRRERPSFVTQEEMDEYRKFSHINPKDSAKGRVELGYMEGFISYEDLGLAKLYREMEKRVKARRSGAQTEHKNFYELSMEARPPY